MEISCNFSSHLPSFVVTKQFTCSFVSTHYRHIDRFVDKQMTSRCDYFLFQIISKYNQILITFKVMWSCCGKCRGVIYYYYYTCTLSQKCCRGSVRVLRKYCSIDTRWCEHITLVLRQLHWLPVRQCIHYKLTTGAPCITKTSIWLPYWWLPARGWLWSTDTTIIGSLFPCCTTLQRHVQRTIVLCGWPMFVEWLAQISLQHRTFSRHFWQTSQNAIVLCFIRLQCISDSFDFYVQFINALTYFLEGYS